MKKEDLIEALEKSCGEEVYIQIASNQGSVSYFEDIRIETNVEKEIFLYSDELEMFTLKK